MKARPPIGDGSTLWVIHIGNDDRIALRARNEDFICIGWTAMGDLSPYDTRPKMRAAMEQAYPSWSAKKINSSYGQTYRFAHSMKVGDPIVLPVRPTSEIALGRIAGPYVWSNDADLAANDYNNFRPVKWLKIVPRTAFSQAALHSFGSFLSVSTSDDYLEEVQAVLASQAGAAATVPVAIDEADSGEDTDAGVSLYETAQQETEDFLLKAWLRTGKDFEFVVAGLFEALGYTATVTPPTGDHGVDVIAHPDPLGLEQPYIKVQVKSGTTTVGEPEVSQLRGLLNAGEQGVFVSLGKFAPGAEAIERNNRNLTLIGPKQFVRLFLDHYEKLDATWRAKFPLKKVYLPVR
jgi:restriction system protein